MTAFINLGHLWDTIPEKFRSENCQDSDMLHCEHWAHRCLSEDYDSVISDQFYSFLEEKAKKENEHHPYRLSAG